MESNRDRLRRLERRAEAIEYLGGICVECGSYENLEFDHIDPATKSFPIAQRPHASWDTLKKELDKCQLLCYDCHKERHEASHGTLSRYVHHKCRCSLCREAKTLSMRKYRMKKQNA